MIKIGKLVKVSDRKPDEFKSVFTWHEKDLIPVCAFVVYERVITATRKLVKENWIRETEGPENMIAPESGKYGELRRAPTHWAEITYD